MIVKQHLKSKPVCKLTFELPRDYEAERIEVCGDFNDWEPLPLKKLKNGKWKLQVDVEAGREYQFRYRGRQNGHEWWDNDPEADGSIGNPFGGQNSLVAC